MLDGGLLTNEGHLVRVGAQLTASALVQVTLDGARVWIRGKVHMVAHLNRVLADVERRLADHLTHEVLLRHLKILLLRLLMLLALEGCE